MKQKMFAFILLTQLLRRLTPIKPHFLEILCTCPSFDLTSVKCIESRKLFPVSTGFTFFCVNNLKVKIILDGAVAMKKTAGFFLNGQ